VAVVLFMSSSLNVNAISVSDMSEAYVTCFEYADSVARVNGFFQGWTYEEEFKVFEKVYNDCLNQ
jgi:hypothetical protein